MNELNFTLITDFRRPYVDQWVNFYDKEYDFTVGTPITLFYGEKFGIVETTYPYHFSIYVFAIPPGSEIPLFKKLNKPFSIHVWGSILGTLTIALIVILIVRKKANNELKMFILGSRTTTPLLNLLRLTLTGEINTNQIPRRNFARFLFANYLLFALIFQSAYTGSLFSILESNLHATTPETIEDIFDQNFKVYLGQGNFYSYDFIPGVAQRKFRMTDMSEFQKVQLKLRTDSEFDGVFPSNLDYILFANRLFVKHDESTFHFCPEVIYSYPRTMTLQKNSLLEKKFSMSIMRLQEAGFLHHWERIHIAAEEDIAQFEKQSNPPKSLSLQKMLGLANILIFGWLASFVAFLFERGIFKRIYSKVRN